MQILRAAVTCVLITACSSTDPQPHSASTESLAPPPSASSTPDAPSAGDSCDLLSDAELVRLVGGPVGQPKAGLTGGLPGCQWATDDGRYVQVLSSTASAWAQGLPEMLRVIEESGMFTDAENLQKLRAWARLVATGHDLDSRKACYLFSVMLRMQGRPAGASWTVNVVPTPRQPQALTGQMCRGGRFTSVMLAAESGHLDEPLPGVEVREALQAAHRRAR